MRDPVERRTKLIAAAILVAASLVPARAAAQNPLQAAKDAWKKARQQQQQQNQQRQPG